jgi:uncharacterized protein HemX
MKMTRKSQNGFAHLGLLLLLLVVVVVGLVGYKVAKSNSTASDGSNQAVSQQAQTIKTKADLNTAAASLNNLNIDNDLNPGSLDNDVNSLL